MSKPALHVLLANPRGFCAGVVRAIDTVEALLARHGPPLYVHHDIVHNSHVVAGLEARGVVFVDSVDDVPSAARLVISAHGAPPAVFGNARRRGLVVVDGTCPLVTKVHREVAIHSSRQNRHILLIGHRDHVEMIGTAGHVDGPVTLIQSIADAEALVVDPGISYAAATQTTLSVDDTKGILTVLRRRIPALIEPRKSDICYATTNRQQAVKAIAARCDGLVIVGGANSSNSRQLVAAAVAAGCPRTWFVSRGNEADLTAFDQLAILGISSGASTPEPLVAELIAALHRRFDLSIEEVRVASETVQYRLPALGPAPSPAHQQA